MKWPLLSIGKVCIDAEQRDPREQPDEYFCYVDIASIDREAKRITELTKILGKEAPSRARKEIQVDDVLVSTVRPNLNAVAIVLDDLDGEIASTGFCVLRADRSRVDPRYLFYCVRSQDFIQYLSNRVTGANYPAVTDKVVKEAPLPLPPLDEQRRIVRLLDEAEALRQLRARADERMAEFIPALFNQMFGDPATNPKGWPIVAMGELLEISPNYGTMIPPKPDEGTWLDLRVANIQDGILDLSDKKYVDLPENMIAKHEVKDGDLLLARAIGSQEHLGKCVIAYPQGEKWAFDSHLMRAQFSRDRAIPEFVRAFLGSASGRRIFLSSTRQSAVQFNINTQEFSAIRFPLPPLSLQHEFAARVAEARTLQDQQARSRARLDEGFQVLLHRAFAGEL